MSNKHYDIRTLAMVRRLLTKEAAVLDAFVQELRDKNPEKAKGYAEGVYCLDRLHIDLGELWAAAKISKKRKGGK